MMLFGFVLGHPPDQRPGVLLATVPGTAGLLGEATEGLGASPGRPWTRTSSEGARHGCRHPTRTMNTRPPLRDSKVVANRPWVPLGEVLANQTSMEEREPITAEETPDSQ